MRIIIVTVTCGIAMVLIVPLYALIMSLSRPRVGDEDALRARYDGKLDAVEIVLRRVDDVNAMTRAIWTGDETWTTQRRRICKLFEDDDAVVAVEIDAANRDVGWSCDQRGLGFYGVASFMESIEDEVYYGIAQFSGGEGIDVTVLHRRVVTKSGEVYLINLVLDTARLSEGHDG